MYADAPSAASYYGSVHSRQSSSDLQILTVCHADHPQQMCILQASRLLAAYVTAAGRIICALPAALQKSALVQFKERCTTSQQSISSHCLNYL